MTCKNRVGEFLFDAEAEVKTGRKHKLAPSEVGRHLARCHNDGTFSRLVSITSKCHGPLLSFDGASEVVLIDKKEVPPTLKAKAAWVSGPARVSYASPVGEGVLPCSEQLSIRV